MTDQKSDQAALNGLVDDCYPDGWPLAVHDLIHHPTRPETVIYHIENEGDIAWIKQIAYYGTSIYPLTDTWVEGRLRELMGEAFLRMEYFDREETPWWEIHYYVDDYIDPLRIARAPTVIQALIAALRAVKNAKA